MKQTTFVCLCMLMCTYAQASPKEAAQRYADCIEESALAARAPDEENRAPDFERMFAACRYHRDSLVAELGSSYGMEVAGQIETAARIHLR